jgi:hypothetical protein
MRTWLLGILGVCVMAPVAVACGGRADLTIPELPEPIPTVTAPRPVPSPTTTARPPLPSPVPSEPSPEPGPTGTAVPPSPPPAPSGTEEPSIPPPEVPPAEPPPCAMHTFYQDLDHDGFGNAAVSAEACDTPADYAANALDCDDTNPLVHPGGKFAKVPTASGSFDYNCDGKEEPEATKFVPVAYCNCSNFGCQGSAPGWYQALPACGEQGEYLVDACTFKREMRVMHCK